MQVKLESSFEKSKVMANSQVFSDIMSVNYQNGEVNEQQVRFSGTSTENGL